MPMNKTQVQHAVSRIRQAQQDKIDQLYDVYGWEDKYLSVDEKVKLVEEGKVKFKGGINQYTRFVDAYDFSKYELKAGISKEGKKRVDNVISQAEEAIDQIQLGDAQEALDVIKKFRSV